jgi:hypothetical protein
MKKLKISKEEFVNALNNIQKGLKEQKEFNDAMGKFSDGFFVSTIGNDFLNTAIRLLEIAVDDEDIPQVGSTISWWLFENVDKVITITPSSKHNKTNKDIEVDCTTPEQLYDYFQKWN